MPSTFIFPPKGILILTGSPQPPRIARFLVRLFLRLVVRLFFVVPKSLAKNLFKVLIYKLYK
jgi:hypothetical protein